MSERLRYTELAPEGIAPMRGLDHYLNATTALPAVLLELVRLRASVLNGCSFCMGHHTRELGKHNEPASRIEAVRDWSASDAFTPRERAALAWTDSVTNIQAGHASDAEYAAVSLFYEGKDLVDLTLAIASINAWNRMSIAFGAEWKPKGGGSPAADAEDRSSEATGGANSPVEPALAEGVESPGTAGSPRETTPSHEDAPTRDVVDDDGGKVAQD